MLLDEKLHRSRTRARDLRTPTYAPGSLLSPRGFRSAMQVMPRSHHHTQLAFRDSDAIWRLFSTIADAIDTDASHIQIAIQLANPTATKDKITEAADQAGLPTTVIDL